jgi:hypothetical protein
VDMWTCIRLHPVECVGHPFFVTLRDSKHDTCTMHDLSYDTADVPWRLDTSRYRHSLTQASQPFHCTGTTHSNYAIDSKLQASDLLCDWTGETIDNKARSSKLASRRDKATSTHTRTHTIKIKINVMRGGTSFVSVSVSVSFFCFIIIKHRHMIVDRFVMGQQKPNWIDRRKFALEGMVHVHGHW